MKQQVDTAFLEKHPGLDRYVASMFEIVRRNKSSWVKEGTGGDSGTPAQHMNTSKSMMLLPESRLFLGKGRGYILTQYVIGAPTIYVHDYYEDKDGNLVTERVINADDAKKKGYLLRSGLKSLGYDLKAEYARSIDLGIEFSFGILDARKYGDDPILLKFIMEHEQNEAAPNASDNRDPKRLKLFQFRPSIPELKAAKSKVVENFDDDLDAMELVSKARTKLASGGYTYNEAVLDTYLSILEDGARLQSGDVLQKFQLVATWAKKDGAEFLRIITGAIEDCVSDVKVAETLKVIAFGASGVKYTDGGAKTILVTESTNKEAALSELVNYLIGNPAGVLERGEIIRQTEIAKLESLR